MKTESFLGIVALAILLSVHSAACVKKSRLTGPRERATANPPAESTSPISFASTRTVTAFVTSPVRASYFYDYMPTSHVDSLAASGMNRAIIKWIADSLTSRGATELRNFTTRGAARGVEIAPSWALHGPTRLKALATTRRYTWSQAKTVEPEVGCPMDKVFLRSALLDRANEIFAVAPGVKRVVVDLELYSGSRHHYDAGPCRCAACIREYRSIRGSKPTLEKSEEQRLTTILTSYFTEFATAHPGVEVGFFDLDFNSFFHRAMALATVKAKVATHDYTERTYRTGASDAAAAKSVLTGLGVNAPVTGGLILMSFTPAELTAEAKAMADRTGGYFIFSTYSLWADPSKRLGRYALQGTPTEYWSAFRAANE